MELLIILPIALHEMKGKRTYQLEWSMPKSKGDSTTAPATTTGIPGASNGAQGHPPRLSEQHSPTLIRPPPRCPSTPQRSPGYTHRGEGPYPLSSLLPLCTFLQGLEDTSNEALNALLCWVVKMVLGDVWALMVLAVLRGSFPCPVG